MRFDQRFVMMTFLGLASATGCHRPHPPAAGNPAPTQVSVTVIKPEKRPIKRVVEQPGTIQAFEETALFARLTGYVGAISVDPNKTNRPLHDRQIDRGSLVKKDQVLVELSVPELDQELKQKAALVKQAEAELIQAEKAHVAAGETVLASTQSVTEAEAGVQRAQAFYERWQSELNRIAGLVKSGVIDSQTRDETQNQFKASEAARNEATAHVAAMRAEVKKSTANREKAAADVLAAKARLEVAMANVGEVNARRQYLKIIAPYDGVVTYRAVNTGDLVSATEKMPLFRVARTDPVRVVVQVPEADAGMVSVGQEVRVMWPALAGSAEMGQVARTSWSLEPGSRTLWTEIDLPNPRRQVRPGMFINAQLTAELPADWTVPTAAIGKISNDAVMYLVEGGKAVRMLVEQGRGDGRFTQIRRYKKAGVKDWIEITGGESIASPASAVTDGQAVP